MRAWWEGVHYQRRFLRLLPSAFMAAEVALLGQRAQPLHLVSLVLHLLNTLLVYRLARRWLRHDGKAALVAAVFGVHPVVVEPVSWFATQPLLVATICSLVAIELWIRYRSRETWIGLLAVLSAVFAALTSYEAAVALPLVLVLGDTLLLRDDLRRSSRWVPRLAVVSLLVPYLALSWLNQAGAVALETSYRPTAAVVWTVARVDLANYVFKALGLINPRMPAEYWIYNALGERVALPLLAAVLLPLAWWTRRRPLALLGLLAFVAFLAPPWLVRATVGAINIPSLRQVYLPLLGVTAVVTAALDRTRLRTAAAVVLPFAVLACVLDRQPRGGVGSGGASAASGRVRAALAETDPARPVVIVGSFEWVPNRSGCLYDVRLDWPRRVQLRLVPLSRSGAAPSLVRTGERTFVALASNGLLLPLAREPLPMPAGRVRYSPGGFRLVLEPPPLVRDGHQDVDGGVVEIVDADAEAVRALRYTLDRPLDEYVFLVAEGCSEAHLAQWDTPSPGREPQ